MENILKSSVIVLMIILAVIALTQPDSTTEKNISQKLNEGIALCNQGKYQEAINLYNEILKDNPKNFALTLRGVAYTGLQNYDAAITDFSKAIEISDKHDYIAYNGRGMAYTFLKQYDAAISDFSKAIEINPEDASIYSNRGNTYLSLKQYDNALADLNKSIEIDPKFSSAYVNRGYLYEDLGETEKASADFAKAKELGYNGQK